MTNTTDAAELLRQIMECEGERVSLKLKELSATFFIFSENKKQLLVAICAFEHPSSLSTIWSVDNRLVLRHFHQEIARLLHNYLSSAVTLIDHTRNIMCDLYLAKPFYNEYQRKIDDTFKKSELAGFIKGLRNWMTHKGPALTEVRLSAEERAAAPISSIVLNRNTLMAWDKWDRRAKAYISSLKTDPKLHLVVSSYGDIIESFYSWLDQRISDLHSSHFQERDMLLTQLKAAQRELD